MTDEAEFIESVDAWLKATMHNGHRQFSQLLRNLPSVDPTVVVRRLKATGAYATIRFDSSQASHQEADQRLPIPHPLDFDWRFHSQTASKLCEELMGYGRPILLLGAPSVFLALADRRFASDVRLVDRNPRLVSVPREMPGHFALDSADAFHWACAHPSALTVFADPPWYPSALEAFLWCAAASTLPGSHVLLSVPQLGTRPGIEEERSRLGDYAQSVGLEVQELREGVLTYVMPPFEANAFSAAGLRGLVPSDWRRGDLMVLRRCGAPLRARPTPGTDDDQHWETFERGGVVIRVKQQADETSDARLLPIVTGDVLGTVSRRDARRANARVWTSGNRIFGCRAPTLLRRLLRGEHVAVVGVEEVLAMVQSVVEAEQAEYRWDGSHGRTALGSSAPATSSRPPPEDRGMESQYAGTPSRDSSGGPG